MSGLVLGIDASRNRSGGAKAHLVGILTSGDPREHGIAKVHVWSHRALLDAVPNADWLVKHCPEELDGPLLAQLWWQYRTLATEAAAADCSILLNTDAGSVCPFRPSVVMSRDMLSYEPGEMNRYGVSRAWARLLALRFVQAYSMKHADGVIFLTGYAARVIQEVTGRLSNVAIVPHGVGDAFKMKRQSPFTASLPTASAVRVLYVSNTDLYKHQWHVVRALGALRARGYKVLLVLAGGGGGPARERLSGEIARTDPRGEFVQCLGFVKPADLPDLLATANIFVFASSCENMPNTLLEGMAMGLPIASSRRGPMPEILGEGGVYFNPEDSTSIASAVESLLTNSELRQRVALQASRLADQYSWERCARETWSFVRSTAAAAAANSRSRSRVAALGSLE